MPAVRSDVKKRKAFEWLVEQVEIVDEDGNTIDRASLELPDEADESADEAVDSAPDNDKDDE